jgi:hypothetical protein
MQDGKVCLLLLIRKNAQIVDITYNPKNLKHLIVLGVGPRWTANGGMAMTPIDRDATLERMKSMADCATCDNYNYVRCRACSWDDAMNIVEEMSEIEAVPVVRCKECMYWKSNILTHFWKPCDTVRTDKDWYCPCGKRR